MPTITAPRPAHSAAIRDRTRSLTVGVVLLLGLWGFGNLYEWNGAFGQLLTPRPGTLVDAFAAGSPFWYFVPWCPLALVGVWILRHRLRGAGPGITDRATRAAVAVTVAAILTSVLVSGVNPAFREGGGLDVDVYRRMTLVWLAGNTIRIGLVAFAAQQLLVWRRA